MTQRTFGVRLTYTWTIMCVVFWVIAVQAQFQWSKRVAGTLNSDTELSIGMALDLQGNCYVTGWFDGTNDFGGAVLTNRGGGGQDIFIAKYNSSGGLVWARRAGGDSAEWDAGRGVGVDGNGNIYVTGGFFGPADFGASNMPSSLSENFFLAKYDSSGVVQWVQQSSSAGATVYGTGLTVDAGGNTYSVGYADNSGIAITFGATNLLSGNTSGYSTFLVKYDSSGILKWGQLMGGSDQTYATKVALDAVGNVYVRGSFTSDTTIGDQTLVATNSTKNMFIAKFNNSGELIWVKQAAGGNVDEGGVAVDQSQNVYVAGWFMGTIDFGGISLTNTGDLKAFVAKYSSSGSILWARQAGAGSLGFYWDVALDPEGNACVAGTLDSAGLLASGSATAVVANYGALGTLQWAYAARGSVAVPFSSTVAKCAVDSAGNCYMAGWYRAPSTFGTNTLQPQGYWDFFVAKVAAPPRPTLNIASSNGHPGLTLTGEIGGVYSVQRLPALVGGSAPWTNRAILAITNRPQFYLDTQNPSGVNSFYRIAPPEL